MHLDRNRPTVAAVVTGLATALGGWALQAVPDTVPADVTGWLYAALVLVACALGVAAGKVAQRQTWARDTFVREFLSALARDADEWSAALAEQGITDADEEQAVREVERLVAEGRR